MRNSCSRCACRNLRRMDRLSGCIRVMFLKPATGPRPGRPRCCGRLPLLHGHGPRLPRRRQCPSVRRYGRCGSRAVVGQPLKHRSPLAPARWQPRSHQCRGLAALAPCRPSSEHKSSAALLDLGCFVNTESGEACLALHRNALAVNPCAGQQPLAELRGVVKFDWLPRSQVHPLQTRVVWRISVSAVHPISRCFATTSQLFRRHRLALPHRAVAGHRVDVLPNRFAGRRYLEKRAVYPIANQRVSVGQPLRPLRYCGRKGRWALRRYKSIPVLPAHKPGRVSAGSWLRRPAEQSHLPTSKRACRHC